MSIRHCSAILLAVAAAVLVLASPRGAPQARAATAVNHGPRLAATCYYSHSSFEDPIFEPEPGEGHAHDFYGNTTTNQESTNESLRTSPDVCKQEGDHSAQWTPQATWGGELIHADRAVIYYEVTPGIPAKELHVFPAWFDAVERDHLFACGKGDFSGEAPSQCGAPYLRVRFLFGQCLDPDDRTVEDNLVPAVEGARKTHCPATHPYLVPRIHFTVAYPIHQPNGPLMVATRDGYSDASFAHADYMNGWNQQALLSKIGLCLKRTRPGEVRPDACRTGLAP